MEGYIKATPRLKWGYELAPDAEGMMRPIAGHIEALNKAIDGILEKRLSLQEGVDYIFSVTGEKLSREGLRRAVAEKDKGVLPSDSKVKDWEVNPDNYERNEDGSFVLRTNGIPVRKRRQARGGYRQGAEAKAKRAVRSSINKKKKDVERLQAKLERQKSLLNKKKEAAQRLDAGDGVANKTPAIISEEHLQSLPQAVVANLEDGTTPVAFRPHPGPQTDFLAAAEKDVLYGGAAGGGKSYAMLVDPLRYVHEKEHRFLILRKTLGELDELIDKSRELYPLAFPGAEYKESKKTWIFPSGAKGYFGYLEKDSDVYQYQGKAYSWIGFDEITHLATSFAWDYLRSRLRTTNPRIKTYMRCTSNPGGPGHAWVKKRYVDPAPYGQTFVGEDGVSRKFIPAKLSDNPTLASDGEYERMLKSMDPVQRQRLLEGDWDIIEGAAFPEFMPHIHVIQPFEIPVHWERVKAIDYGYRAPSCCLWAAVDPDDGTIIFYRELYAKGLTGKALGEAMHQAESQEMREIMGVLDGASWNTTGSTGPTVGEELLRSGHKLRRADKNRKAGKIQIHERLKIRENGKPKMLIFSNCVNWIKQLQVIPLDKNDNEDVDTTAEDHAYDAGRYLLMSRPPMEDVYTRMARYKADRHIIYDEEFGY